MKQEQPKQRDVFSRNLRYLMRKNGLSQVEFSKAVGFPNSSVAAWTRGLTFPRIQKLEKIAEYFNTDVPTLLTKDMGQEEGTDTAQTFLSEMIAGTTRQLNKEGKWRVFQYSQDLSGNPKYTTPDKKEEQEVEPVRVEETPNDYTIEKIVSQKPTNRKTPHQAYHLDIGGHSATVMFSTDDTVEQEAVDETLQKLIDFIKQHEDSSE